MASRTTPVFLDRIEGDFGVLTLKAGGSVDIPVDCLPEGVKEGTALTLTLAVDETATAQGKQEVADLMKELLQRPGG